MRDLAAERRFRFRYFTLVPAIERGKPVEIERHGRRWTVKLVGPHLTAFDAWLLCGACTHELRRELESPNASIDHVAPDTLVFTELDYTPISSTARGLISAPTRALHILADLEHGQMAALKRLAGACDQLLAAREPEARLGGVRDVKNILEEEARYVLASIWFDECLVSTIRTCGEFTDLSGQEFYDACLPENGVLIAQLPGSLLGAKRPDPSRCVELPWTCVSFLQAHTAVSDVRPASAMIDAAKAALRMSERLSQFWTLLVCALSRTIASLTGWATGWPDRIVELLAAV
jgi:hypothetical protein